MSESYGDEMERLRKSYRKRREGETRRRGLFIVNTGDGKGKSTSAFGTALRALGHGMKVAVVQFIKGTWKTGEVKAVKRFGDRIEWHRMGEGFTWDTQDKERDREAAGRAWRKSEALMRRTDLGLLILDELNVALHLKQLPVPPVLAALESKAEHLHVIVTGRDAPQELIDRADLVTEMKLVKHPYSSGVGAQKGIEF